MTTLDVVALFLGLIAALTMWGVAVTINMTIHRDPTMDTRGAKLAQWMHLYWGITVAVMAAAVVYR
jgi:hypothetical protein